MANQYYFTDKQGNYLIAQGVYIGGMLSFIKSSEPSANSIYENLKMHTAPKKILENIPPDLVLEVQQLERVLRTHLLSIQAKLSYYAASSSIFYFINKSEVRVIAKPLYFSKCIKLSAEVQALIQALRPFRQSLFPTLEQRGWNFKSPNHSSAFLYTVWSFIKQLPEQLIEVEEVQKHKLKNEDYKGENSFYVKAVFINDAQRGFISNAGAITAHLIKAKLFTSREQINTYLKEHAIKKDKVNIIDLDLSVKALEINTGFGDNEDMTRAEKIYLANQIEKPHHHICENTSLNAHIPQELTRKKSKI